jgi:hypothetical protein
VGVYVLMELDNQIKFGHLLLFDRKCRTCGEIKNLIDGFYQTRKDRGPVASSYSYECKECTVKRILESRKNKKPAMVWEYPDW